MVITNPDIATPCLVIAMETKIARATAKAALIREKARVTAAFLTKTHEMWTCCGNNWSTTNNPVCPRCGVTVCTNCLRPCDEHVRGCFLEPKRCMGSDDESDEALRMLIEADEAEDSAEKLVVCVAKRLAQRRTEAAAADAAAEAAAGVKPGFDYYLCHNPNHKSKFRGCGKWHQLTPVGDDRCDSSGLTHCSFCQLYEHTAHFCNERIAAAKANANAKAAKKPAEPRSRSLEAAAEDGDGCLTMGEFSEIIVLLIKKRNEEGLEPMTGVNIGSYIKANSICRPAGNLGDLLRQISALEVTESPMPLKGGGLNTNGVKQLTVTIRPDSSDMTKKETKKDRMKRLRENNPSKGPRVNT